MLLTLIKRRKTRFGYQAELIETNHVFGNKSLARLFLCYGSVPLELIYPVSITRSGIYLRNQKADWWWPDPLLEQQVNDYLRTIQAGGEEIYLEITHNNAPILQ